MAATSAPVPALPATTIVLLRPCHADPGSTFETCLLERAPTSSFLAKAHVFPGGRVDPEDHDPAWPAMCDGVETLAARLVAHLPRAEAVAHAVAGIREVFEETGLLLARTPVSDAEAARARRDLLDGRATFRQWCASTGTRLSLEALLPWAHWITPEGERKRFDTWFLLAVVPPEPDVSVIPGEIVAGAWHTPLAALSAYDKDALVLAPPTVRTFEELAEHPRVAAVCEASPQRALGPILPRLIDTSQGPLIVLPGDPDYGPLSGPALAPPTRFVRRGKRWVPASVGDPSA
jgi:8-oxo-dGTP pyrophosphatase MutT (NUDIX family)